MERQYVKLTNEVTERKNASDVHSAKKKLAERRVVSAQLERLRSSQHVIAMNLGAVKNAELNKSLVSTLRATGEAMKLLTPNEDNDIQQVEDVMFNLEDQIKRSRDIDDVLSKPFTHDSIVVSSDERELSVELDGLGHDDVFTQDVNGITINQSKHAVSGVEQALVKNRKKLNRIETGYGSETLVSQTETESLIPTALSI